MRCRLFFRKGGASVYTSALDLQKIWERSLKRARLLVKYSEGFHPQPKIQLAVPLPLGYEGRAEIIDVWFCEHYGKDEILSKLNHFLPEGIEVYSIEEISENQKALNSLSESAEYIIVIDDEVCNRNNLNKFIHDMLEKKTIERTKNKKTYDLRPLILSAGIGDCTNLRCQLHLKLLARPGSTGRPDEFLNEIGIDPALCKIERIRTNFNS